jgi:hypothetical protein
VHCPLPPPAPYSCRTYNKRGEARVRPYQLLEPVGAHTCDCECGCPPTSCPLPCPPWARGGKAGKDGGGGGGRKYSDFEKFGVGITLYFKFLVRAGWAGLHLVLACLGVCGIREFELALRPERRQQVVSG